MVKHDQTAIAARYGGSMNSLDINLMDVNDHQDESKYSNISMYWPSCIRTGRINAGTTMK